MTNRELIDRLSMLSPTAEVVVSYDAGCAQGPVVGVRVGEDGAPAHPSAWIFLDVD